MTARSSKSVTQDELDDQVKRLEDKREKLAAARAELTPNLEQVALESHKVLLDAEEARIDRELKEALAAANIKTVRSSQPALTPEDQMALDLANSSKGDK